MACKEFMPIHPGFGLLALPPIVHFVFGVSDGLEVFVSGLCVVIGLGIFAYRMTLVAIQFLDFT